MSIKIVEDRAVLNHRTDQWETRYRVMYHGVLKGELLTKTAARNLRDHLRKTEAKYAAARRSYVGD